MGQTNFTHSTIQNILMANSQRACGENQMHKLKQMSHRESGPLKTKQLMYSQLQRWMLHAIIQTPTKLLLGDEIEITWRG